MRAAIPLAILTLGFVLFGCGGGGGGTTITETTVKFSVNWGERSRAFGGPSSALSMVLRITGAGVPNGDFLYSVNRDADITAHTSNYTSGPKARSGNYTVTATFYADVNSGGDVVGVATGPMTVNKDGTLSGSISTAGTIASVQVAPGQSVGAGETKQLDFTTRDSGGGLIAVSPGSAVWNVVSGSDKLTFENGYAKGLIVGSATATASVDGVTSAAVSIQVTDTNKIAFYSWRDGNAEIYIMNVDGSNQINLTNHSANDFHPAWSPDRQRIAFSTLREGNSEIYVMNSDGSAQQNISSNTAEDGYPAYSPDGSKIAFASNRNGGTDQIWIMNADGSQQTQLTFLGGNNYDPVWSPDGSRIAFASHNDGGNSEIYVINVDGTGATRLTFEPAPDNRPAWSPTGDRIAFTSGRAQNYDIYSMKSDGSDVLRLTNEVADDWFPAWSPAGNKLAFTTERNGSAEIYSMSIDGSGPIRLTNGSINVGPAWR